MAQCTHKEIVDFLREEHGVPSWWQQSITNQFEQLIGRRSKYETDDGFQMSISRTLEFPAALIFGAWANEEQRSKWMPPGDFEPTTIKEPKIIRGRWIPNDSRIDVEISNTAKGGCKLRIQHRKLASNEFVEQMRDLWKKSIDRLIEWIASAR